MRASRIVCLGCKERVGERVMIGALLLVLCQQCLESPAMHEQAIKRLRPEKR